MKARWLATATVAAVILTGMTWVILRRLTTGRIPSQTSWLQHILEKRILFTESVSVTRVESEAIAVALAEYFRLFGVYPNGGNLFIAKALAGENPMKIKILAFKHVGNDGELLDPWGTPYDIQVTEDGRLRVQSAGPNLTWGDADDILQDHPLSSGKSSPPNARPR